MNTLEFAIVCYALLLSAGLTALLTWTNYKAMYKYKDGKTVINWNTRGEGKPEFYILLFSFILSMIALFIFVGV